MPIDLSHLNHEQRQAVTHADGPLLLVAGAGTGKTAVITHRAAHLIDSGRARSNEVLALTFTEKAAQEMGERIDGLLPYGYLDLWISTFHSFADRLLKMHALDIGISNDYKLLNQTDAWLLVRKNLALFDLDYYRPLGNPAKFIHALIKHFSRCKDEVIAPSDYITYAERLRLDADAPLSGDTSGNIETKRITELANAYHIYNQLLLDNNSFDFGDLLIYALRLLKERPAILKRYREQFKYILIDEFQDTNWAQYEIIKLVAGSARNIMVVGDDDQAIFKFRGASISNILQFEKDFPDAKKIFLTVNYRSFQNLLDNSYQFIQLNNPNRLEFQLQKLKTGTALNKKLTAQRKVGGIIEYHNAQTVEAETLFTAERIRNLYQTGGESSSWNDFAILVRANSLAEPFMNAFEKQGIPYQFLASSGLYRQKLILDLCAYLRLLDNYHENAAVYRVLNMALWDIPASDIIRLTHHARKHSWSLYETLKHAGALKINDASCATIYRILGLIERHSQLSKDKPVSMVAMQFLQDSGLLKMLVQKEQSGESNALKEVRELKLFFEDMRDFENRSTENGVRQFIQEFDFILDSGDSGAIPLDETDGPETVKILTVHTAKGLEFKYVFIVNLVDSKFPSIGRKDPIEIPDELIKEQLFSGDEHLEEERRLFYVALTRARDGVFLTSAKDYGGSRVRKPSRFLVELGYVEKKSKNSTDGNMPESSILNLSINSSEKASVKNEISHLIPKLFSYTQLKAFETCPMQYKFAHILRIPMAGKPSFSFGKTMHSTMQKFYQQMIDLNNWQQADLFGISRPSTQEHTEENGQTLKVPPLETLLKLYEASWIDEWYQDKFQKRSYYEKGKEMLKTFYAIHERGWLMPKFLELGFTFKIAGNTLRGAIDRIDELQDGGIEIIDYKTGKPKEEDKLSAEDKEQLIIYQIAASEALGMKPKLLSFYYLETNHKISFLGDAEAVKKLKDKIIQIIEQIKASRFPAKPSSHTCHACDFKTICDFAVL